MIDEYTIFFFVYCYYMYGDCIVMENILLMFLAIVFLIIVAEHSY